MRNNTLDPSTGPMPREEFYALVEAPHGTAAKAIRKHDPFWGLPDGAKIEWCAIFTKEVEVEGYAYIKAASKSEAEVTAKQLTADKIEYDPPDLGCGTFRFSHVEVEDCAR